MAVNGCVVQEAIILDKVDIIPVANVRSVLSKLLKRPVRDQFETLCGRILS